MNPFLSFENHREIAGTVAALIAKQLSRHIRTKCSAQHVDVSGSSFGIPSLESIFGHGTKGVVVAVFQPFDCYFV